MERGRVRFCAAISKNSVTKAYAYARSDNLVWSFKSANNVFADGASLIYTIPSVSSPLPSLIQSSLGIHSLLKRQPLKHNVIDRDKVVVPVNWDSWGKIRVLREGFDVEAVSQGWSLDIDEAFEPNGHTNGATNGATDGSEPSAVAGGAVAAFEDVIRDPSLDSMGPTATENDGLSLEVSSLEHQNFLATQLEFLEKLRQTADTSGMDSSKLGTGRQTLSSGTTGDEGVVEEGRVNEHIGPVQFNMGGIQVDADDMLQRLKVCLLHLTYFILALLF